MLAVLAEEGLEEDWSCRTFLSVEVWLCTAAAAREVVCRMCVATLGNMVADAEGRLFR